MEERMFSKQLNEKLDKYHLLKHPFYKSWNEGKLTREIIKDYAEQYYQHVKAFPRYISATHSLCEDIEKRKILLENLQDEENQDKDHPKLWRNFAAAMGAKKEEIDSVKKEKFTKELIDNFFKNGRASYAEGLEFFEVHKNADIYHRAACEKLLDSLSEEEQIKAEKSALSTAKYLWNFLTGMAVKHNIPSQIAA
jgi:pyrroloquinoline-quinone synthase